MDGDSPTVEELQPPTNGKWPVSCADRPPAGIVAPPADSASLPYVNTPRRASHTPGAP